MTAAAATTVGPCSAHLVVAQDGAELRALVAKHVASSAAKAIAERGRFIMALSGGSMPQTLAGLVDVSGLEWDKVWVLFSDERCVALEDDDSNFKACKTHLFDKVPLPPDHVLCLDPALPPDKAAHDYQAQLQRVTGTPQGEQCPPVLDLVLLGMGPDGHTASLFPHHPLLQPLPPGTWVAAISDSPKPPPCRITLTRPVLDAAREVAFIASGSSKADLFHQALTLQQDHTPSASVSSSSSSPLQVVVAGGLPYPAFMVRPSSGALYWYTDTQGAHRVLSSPTTTGGAAAL